MFLEKKEAMVVIDEDPFPPVASINIAATNLRALMNAKKAEGFSPSARIRKIWIPKQYFVYMDDLVARRRVTTTRKKEKGMNDHSKRKIPLWFVIPLTVSHGQEWHV